MLTGIVAGFGEPIGAERLTALRAHGFRLIRQDLQTVMGRNPRVDAVISEGNAWEAAGGKMLYIVDTSTLGMVPDGSWVEYLNEPEYQTPHTYAHGLAVNWPVACDKGLTLWAGGIGNLDADSMLWLQRVLAEAPYVTHISVHRYPPDAAQSPDKAHKGMAGREGELRWLRDIIGPRPFVVSEVGYHTAWRRQFWFWRTRLSAVEQAARLCRELDFWRAEGAEACCLYQENDGAGAGFLDHYGLKDCQGTWKTGVNYGDPW